MINEISFPLVIYWFQKMSAIFYLRVTDSEMDGQTDERTKPLTEVRRRT